MFKKITLGALEAEKLQKTKWKQYCWTPCSYTRYVRTGDTHTHWQLDTVRDIQAMGEIYIKQLESSEKHFKTNLFSPPPLLFFIFSH